jgi:hypothetical protein
MLLVDPLAEAAIGVVVAERQVRGVGRPGLRTLGGRDGHRQVLWVQREPLVSLIGLGGSQGMKARACGDFPCRGETRCGCTHEAHTKHQRREQRSIRTIRLLLY